jgi:hypothetical protein
LGNGGGNGGRDVWGGSGGATVLLLSVPVVGGIAFNGSIIDSVAADVSLGDASVLTSDVGNSPGDPCVGSFSCCVGPAILGFRKAIDSSGGREYLFFLHQMDVQLRYKKHIFLFQNSVKTYHEVINISDAIIVPPMVCQVNK